MVRRRIVNPVRFPVGTAKPAGDAQPLLDAQGGTRTPIPKVRVSLILSAAIGGIFCTLADLLQKAEASAVLLIGRKLDEIFSGVYWANVIAISVVVALAVAVAIIFESDTKKSAFYLGASVLALLMTMTPYEVSPGFKTAPNSVEVDLSIDTQDGKPAKGALVTLRDASGKQILSRSRLPGSQLRFYQDEGTYQLTVELAGYRSRTEPLSVTEGSPPQSMSVTLQPSSTPLILQRILR
jgi:hypothetical protein